MSFYCHEFKGVLATAANTVSLRITEAQAKMSRRVWAGPGKPTWLASPVVAPLSYPAGAQAPSTGCLLGR